MTDQVPPSPDASTSPGRVTDRRLIPPGVVPRHLQQWALAGIAVVMVGILALSGPPAKPPVAATPSPAALAVDPNQQRIEDYQRRIQEQAERLAAEQAQLQATKEAVGATPASADGSAPRPSTADASAPTSSPAPTRDTREDHARFADNVAFARSSTPPVPNAGATPDSAGAAPIVASTMPPLVAPPGGLQGAPLATVGPASVATPQLPATRPTAPRVGGDPQYTLLEGTIIETVLTNRLDGTFSGPVNCLVSVPVYAADHLVIPAGARVLGEARAVDTFGQSRLAVTFHRLLLPNGVHVDLDSFRGLNQIGDLGLRDAVNHHYAQIFGVSLALGAVAGFAQGQSSIGVDASAVDTYRQGVAASVSQSSTRVLDRFLNLLPTVTIREGHRIKVYLSGDLELPAYRDTLRSTGGRP